MLQYFAHTDTRFDINIEASLFEPTTPRSVRELHLMLHYTPPRAAHTCSPHPFEQQCAHLHAALQQFLADRQFQNFAPVAQRYFLSDSANQAPLLSPLLSCATSIIQQPPLDGSKIALWVYLQEGVSLETLDHNAHLFQRNGYTHLWQGAMTSPYGDSAQQTRAILENYEAQLNTQQARLADHCVRTWFYARDVDTNYAGLVEARRENFLEQGLTPETHYIASTGIQGAASDPRALVQMEAYALMGFEAEQQRYLRALSHMNPTIEYGVTFERGTLISFADRAHAYISGTASIDAQGRVMHEGNIELQLQRMLENVQALLSEADMTMERDIAQIIVYLRDIADYPVVSAAFNERFAHIPTLITHAPVCRPTWLIEMECIAIAQRNLPRFRPF